jgi:pimeloyl-ACP methyl ester carboxylesterase
MRNWRAGRVPVSGGFLTFHRTGGDGPPLVLSHGLTDNGLCWSRLAAALETKFDVIMLDARGHGGSSRLSAPGACDPGQDIAEAIDGLALRAPIVIGHSVGARATAAYANTPSSRAAKVILEDPPFLPLVEPSAAEVRARKFREHVERFQTMSNAEIIASGRVAHALWHDDEFPAWAAAKRQVDPSASPAYTTPWQAQVHQITAPTLLIHGEAKLGSLVTPAIAAEAAALNSNIQFAAIPDAGHNVRRENFSAYLAALLSFLSATASGPPALASQCQAGRTKDLLGVTGRRGNRLRPCFD